MFETYLFSDEWNEEEKDNLIKKSAFYMEQTNLPEQIVKPHRLVYDKDGKCTGYTYRNPSGDLISLKDLFQPEEMERYHIDCQVLYLIAKKVWQLAKKLTKASVYPGFLDLACLFVSKEHPEKGVYLFHPEYFQTGNLPSSYPWYPSDSRLFEEEFELFDEKKQMTAYGKTIYKIMTASSKGNAKIPPNQKNQDHSWIYWNHLSKEWIDLFLSMGQVPDLSDRLDELFSQELVFEKNEIEEQKKKAYALITVLKQADKSLQDMSRELYILQEKIEQHPVYDFDQGFVLGNKHPFTKEFRHYPKGYRSQLGHVISAYHFGEALIIAAETMEAALKKEERPSYLFILLDGEIKNDIIFKFALKKLAKLRNICYTELVLVPVEELKGEGYQLLKQLCMKGKIK